MIAVLRRLGVLVEAYGTFTALEVLAAVPDRLQAAADMTEGMAAAGDEAFAALVASGNLNDGREAVASFRTALLRLQTRLCRHGQAPCPGSDRGSAGG